MRDLEAGSLELSCISAALSESVPFVSCNVEELKRWAHFTEFQFVVEIFSNE